VAELPPHGTRRQYQLGCRCDDCRAANAAYIRAHKRGLCGTRAEHAATVEDIVAERIAWRPRSVAELIALPIRARDW
jgi:hypothetical protein